MNISNFLSNLGKRVDFPSSSIIEQSALQKHVEINASVGTTTDGNEYLYSPEIKRYFNLSTEEIFQYSGCLGVSDLRNKFKKRILEQNNLHYKDIGTPVITTGVTQALYISSLLFLNEGDNIYIPNLSWENYNLIFKGMVGCKDRKIDLYKEDRFDVSSIKNLNKNTKSDKLVFIFNFPNNPTGYNPTSDELDNIVDILLDNYKNKRIVVILDEAGYGFNFINEQSDNLFSKLVGKSKNIIPVLAKGATKEDLAYGLRIASLTFGIEECFSKILEEKAGAIIRGTVSAVCTTSQQVINKSFFENKQYVGKVRDEMEKRYHLIFNEILPNIDKDFYDYFSVYPCNSGFFMTLKSKINTKELLRESNNNGIGFSLLDDSRIRVSFSSLNMKHIEIFFEKLLLCARKI